MNLSLKNLFANTLHFQNFSMLLALSLPIFKCPKFIISVFSQFLTTTFLAAGKEFHMGLHFGREMLTTKAHFACTAHVRQAFNFCGYFVGSQSPIGS